MEDTLGDVYVACVALLLTNKSYEVGEKAVKCDGLDIGTYKQVGVVYFVSLQT